MLLRVQTSAQQLSQLQDPSTNAPPTATTASTLKQKGSLLLRWVTFEKDVFTPLYRATLALATMSPSLTSSTPSSTPNQIIEIVGKAWGDLHPILQHTLREWGTSAHIQVPASWEIESLSLFFLTSL
jgi:hypothetical protein